MKKKAFNSIELMLVFLILGILTAVVIPIMRARINTVKDEELKTGYFASEQFKEIVTDSILEGKDVVGRFEKYQRDKYSHLSLATDQDLKKYLEQSKDSDFERKVLEGLLEFKIKAF